jgi:hypothetical protein
MNTAVCTPWLVNVPAMDWVELVRTLQLVTSVCIRAKPCCLLSCCSFEEIVAALSQEPATTEEMDALEKYLNKTQQVRATAGFAETTNKANKLCTVPQLLCTYQSCMSQREAHLTRLPTSTNHGLCCPRPPAGAALHHGPP